MTMGCILESLSNCHSSLLFWFCVHFESGCFRLIELFAKKYNRDNDNPFTDDGAFFLAMATLMLNTQKHNPNAERSMTVSASSYSRPLFSSCCKPLCMCSCVTPPPPLCLCMPLCIPFCVFLEGTLGAFT